jgi:hypothetical protein
MSREGRHCRTGPVPETTPAGDRPAGFFVLPSGIGPLEEGGPPCRWVAFPRPFAAESILFS